MLKGNYNPESMVLSVEDMTSSTGIDKPHTFVVYDLKNKTSKTQDSNGVESETRPLGETEFTTVVRYALRNAARTESHVSFECIDAIYDRWLDALEDYHKTQ